MKDLIEHRYLAFKNLQLVSVTALLVLLVATPALAASSMATAEQTAQPPMMPTLEPADGAGMSANWAGYVAQGEGDTYTGVNGNWIVPEVSVGNATKIAADATWVGIGGVSADDLIQAGTQAIIQDGEIEYQAWYEILPHYQTPVPLVVRANDSISVSLVETDTDEWHLTIANNTTGKTYQKTIHYHSSHSSAEWIEEMPVGGTGKHLTYLPLDNFGKAYFTHAGATVNGVQKTLEETGAEPLTMVHGMGQTLATPSVIDDNGSSFIVAREEDTHVVDSTSRKRGIFTDGNSIYIVWQF